MRFGWFLALIATAACGEDTRQLERNGADASVTADAADIPHDAGVADSGQVVRDAAPSDAGAPFDASNTTDTGVPVCNTPAAKSVAIATDTILALLEDGTLWSWGDRVAAGLPYDESCCTQRPQQIAPGRTFRAVTAGGAHACAIDSNSQLWCWGFNRYGQVGTATTAWQRYEPIQVGIDADWALVAAGARHTCGLKTNGSLFCWGSNEEGQLGLGEDRTPRITPERVNPGETWLNLGLGSYDSCAIKSDRSLWCWGYNAVGALGVGDNVPRRVPVQVGRAQSWAAVELGAGHTLALNDAGWLHAWGRNYEGELGLGDDRNRYQPSAGDPTRVWTQIDAGHFHHSCGLTNQGEMFCWGNNAEGQLGSGDFLEKHEPTKISGNIWRTISAGWQNSCAIDDRQRLWCWGSASQNVLGPQITEDRASPVLICW